ncbi:MAG TPA: molybdopterin-dependent oxidoreductase [Acidobacteriota bacterium]|nr:molybdopterin-dependent oxidoreductase [Acidobacteriota bacterium]
MKLRIDGREITLTGPSTLLEAARANGIDIPSLCDHPQLAPYAACRLCLVEVKGRRGYAPACSTAAEDGLEVTTATPDLQTLRRGILELILAEHPHACLICAEKPACDDYKSTIRKTGEVTGCVLCPANGRCELQRVVEAVGLNLVQFPSHRRAGEVRRDDPFIDRDNSLCILCGRCVRVCEEVRGASVLTFVSRGSETVVGTALDRRLLDSACQFCGACVDVCPTGSLAERATRYDRPPEAEASSVCTLCGQGCRLLVRTREGRVVGTSPDPEGAANRGQACVKGRFLVRPALGHPRRLLKPLIKENGSLREAGWEEALTLAAARLAAFGPGQVAVAASAQSSCEDLFVLHRFAAEVLRAPGLTGPWTASAAAALEELGRSRGRAVPLNFRFADVSGAGAIVVAAENLPTTQPIAGLHVHKAAIKGAALIRLEAGKRPSGLSGRMDASRPVIVLFGPGLLERRQGLDRLAELWDLVIPGGGRLLALDREANTRGGLAIAAASPRFGSLKPARALYVAGPCPGIETAKADFVVVQASYRDESFDAADIVLPEATSFEAEGTFVNIEGRIQLSAPAVAPPGEARPGWRILSELAVRLGGADFDYRSAADVRTALASAVPALAAAAGAAGPEPAFVAEGTSRPTAGSGRKTAGGPAGAKFRPAPRDPDDFKGLRLAEENKSLKLVRGRRCPRS